VWAVRAGLQFLFHVGVAVAVGLAVAAIWAVAHGGGFGHSLFLGFMVIGALLLLLGASGQSSAGRNLETAGRLPGVPAWTQSKPGDTSLRPGVLLILAGLALLGIGIAVHGG
jgi:hypothetical protein